MLLAANTIFSLLIATSTVSARLHCALKQEFTCGGYQSTSRLSGSGSSKSDRGNGFSSASLPSLAGGAMSIQDRIAAAREFVSSFRQNSFQQGAGNGFSADVSPQFSFDVSPATTGQCAQFQSQGVDAAQERHASFLASNAQTIHRADKARTVQCITQTVTESCGLKFNDLFSTAVAPSGAFSDSLGAGVGSTSNALGINCSFVGDEPLKNNCNDRISQRIRTFEGECNNLQRQGLGSDGTTFQRLLDPVYDDGENDMRRKSLVDGRELPLGRKVSTCTSPLVDNMHPWMSQVGALFGQFVTHDFVLTPTTKIKGRDNQQKPPKCCGVPEECLHEDCFPIPIPTDDEAFSRIGKTCMEFVRSAPALREQCNIGHREQLNQETHYLDLSVVYGSQKARADKIRAKQDGLLSISPEVGAAGGELLPPAEDSASCKRSENNNHACFLGGEQRTNENSVLIALQTLFLRSHNRLARGLKRLADQVGIAYNDEALFQTARKILIATYQHITYNEMLPIILGQSGVSNPSHQLQLCGSGYGSTPYCSADGFYQGYSSSVSPQVIHEFSTAAFRLHTLVPDELAFADQQKHLGDDFFTVRRFYESDAVSNVLTGSARASCQFYDQKLVRSLRDELFRKPGDKGGLGLDLLTLNIYRGRDHGLNSYNTYREKCGVGRARSWSDLSSTMTRQAVGALQCAYQNVEDIDLFAGCISETPKGDAVVGPTAACIISEQFQRTRQGDRFWYENPGQFDQAQLKEIRKTRFSTLVCATTSVQQVFPHAMLLASRRRESPVPCSAVERMDLSVFLSILSEFSNLLGVPQQPPSPGRSTRYPPPPPSNYRPGVPTTNYVRNNNNKYPVDSSYFRKYFPKKASSFTPYVTYTKQYSRPNAVTYKRPWASSLASSSGSGSSTSFSSSGNGGSYARATSYSGKQYNPYDKLFNYWKPTQWKPQSQTLRFSFKSGCSSCVTLYDAISADDIKNFTAETACVAYVEQVFGEVKNPKDLEKEVAALQKKELHDPSPLILQCCYREFKHKFLPKDEAKLAEYPEPKGFEKGKSCKDVVQSLLKLMKGDYEQPAKPAESETKNAAKTADPKTQNDVKLAPELVNESFP